MVGVAQLRPEILDNYNFDYITREMSKASGMPEEAFLDERMVARVREIRLQQQQAQQQMEQMAQMGKAAPGLNEPVQEGSVLEGIGKAAVGATSGAPTPVP
jgi:hypothetical protein